MQIIPRSKAEIDEIISMIRLELYNHDRPCGPKAILEEMKKSDVKPLPSERTISRFLARRGLTHRRTGWYPGEKLKANWSREL